MIPSANTIEQRIRVDRKTALLVRRLMDGRADPALIPETKAWLDQCYGVPQSSETRLHAIDAVLKMHGVEGFTCQHKNRRDVHVSYANTGDSYHATVLWVSQTSLYPDIRVGWYVCGWADMLESLERRGWRCD